MSRTKRSHWLKEEMRDGEKRNNVKTKKDKSPPVLDEELEDEGLYFFDDEYNLD